MSSGRKVPALGGVQRLSASPHLKWEESLRDSEPKHQWIFFHPHHPECRAKGFLTAFRRACKNAGLPGLRPNDFRHFFISTAIMVGCEMLAVSRWVGHGSLQMIQKRYGHLSKDYHAEQIRLIDLSEERKKSA
jgi:integrase